MQKTDEITQSLIDARNGDEKAMNHVFEKVYDSLRNIARNHLDRNRLNETMNTTALVHEAYERLVGNSGINVKDRTHFFCIASRAMRFVLVDYARSKSAGKRGGMQKDSVLDEMTIRIDERSAELLDLDEALKRLSDYDANLARIVELRFFGGLTYEEIADMESRSVRSIKRDWQRARTWIYWVMKSDI